MAHQKSVGFGLAIAALCAAAWASPAKAAETQDILAFERAKLRSTCQRIAFEPGFLRRVDLDGDGVADAIVDYGKLQCDGSSMMFCGSGGCTYRFYAGLPGGRFSEAGEVLARNVEQRSRNGRSQIIVTSGGSACGRANVANCVQAGTLTGGRLVLQRGR